MGILDNVSKFDDVMNVPFEELQEEIERLGYCTAWELYTQYGISKVKTSRAIRSGKILGFMKGLSDNKGNTSIERKWYIVKNKPLEYFIEKNKLVSPTL